jgi:hypothetical protein
MNEPFSKRFGFRKRDEPPITIREDAPSELRSVVVDLAYECGANPQVLRPWVCRVLKTRPDSNNWSEFPNIDREIRGLLDDAQWYQIYDAIEAIGTKLSDKPFEYRGDQFETELNDYFVAKGIGWKLADGVLETRGAEGFELALAEATEVLSTGGFQTASSELHEAISDLSRRPEPDITGAIQHGMAALECVARLVSGDGKANLGDILKRYGDLVPKPLDEALAKLWGYASENARHLREGRVPSHEEAELVVLVVAAVSTYLTRKHEA